jgi:signal transduction histidine kinase/ligand-binding sensor domain-containing protein/DNA-binding NarL/FixJ family response regulator
VKKRNAKQDRYIPNFLFFLWGIFFTFSTLMALDPKKAVTQYKHDTWQLERGLEQKSVISVCQTHNGYIWLGTLDGLVRFDGIHFKTFTKENTEQLQDNLIRVLLEDKDNRLWIGTENGGLSCLKNGIFITYSPDVYPGLKNILAIFMDRKGTLWIGTSGKGITCLKEGIFTTYTNKNGLASNKVHAFHEDEDGNIWIGTSEGISIYNPTAKPVKFKMYNGTNALFNKHIKCMYSTKKGELWFGCTDGIYRLKNNTFSHFGKNLTKPGIISLFVDSDQNIWAGTNGSGLVRVKNDRLETFPPGHVLATDFIYAICEDREKNLWIGSSDEGLHRLIDTLFTPYTTREGLSNNIVNCIHEGRGDTLWIGTREGVNCLSKNGEAVLKWTNKDGLFSNNIKALLEDNQGSLWIGTDSGLNRYNEGKIEGIDYPVTVSNHHILQLEEDKYGAVWILTTKHLIRFYKGTFTPVIKKEEVTDELLLCFRIDREDTLWLGTYGGEGLYSQKNGKRTQYTTENGLVHNDVESIYEDKEANLYIGTRGGLSIMANGEFTNYTTQDGLSDNCIYFLLVDESGYVWLAGRTGISRINKRELSDFKNGKIERVNPVLYNESDGMKIPFCTDCIKTRDGKLWLATDKGLATIDPIKIKRNPQPPLVEIEELIADGVTTHIGSLRLQYGEDTPLNIPAGTNRLEFKYTGLSFVKSRKIKFKVKLDEYDDNWREMGIDRSTDYTNLSPGNYTFRVTACNSDGVWNKEGASFSFYLHPYIYQTFWFYFFSALFIFITVFAAYRLRVRGLKHRQRELATLVEERTREVEDKNQQLEEQSEKLKEMDKIKSRFFANISHEFRTPLTLLMGPLEQLITDCSEGESERKRKLTLMLRNAQRLLRLINQLLELSKLDSGKMKLKAIKLDVVSFVKGITDSFRFLVQQKEMDLVFQVEGEDETKEGEIILYIDPRKMEDIMSNLLINAVKFTPAGGEIRVTVKELETVVEISVSDTGPGIPADQLAHVFDRFYQADATYEHYQKGSGIGLALSKELVELHHGTITARSNEGDGTTFTVLLPKGTEHLTADEIIEPGNRKNTNGYETLSNISAEIVRLEKELEKEGQETETTNGFDLDRESSVDEPNIILVVEDSTDMREYIKEALEPDYRVVEAEDGKEGMQKAQEIIPDLIISDIMMPEMDGYELCRALKSDVQTSHIPVILLTAKAAEENIVEGLETGADDYITKPFSTLILSARIKNLIDIRSQLQQNVKREMTMQPVKTSVSKIDREFLKDLQAVLKENVGDPEFNVEEMCKRLYMGNTTLYRKVQALSGQSPTEFLRTYRLKQAAQLLKSGFGSVTEVAFEVGFSSRAYFTKCFKEKFHQLPSEYSEANRQ